MESVTLFIFRRDLRAHDNTALIEAARSGSLILTCFIFDPVQIERHDYFSEKGFQYMLESLESLASSLRERGGLLHFFLGKPHEVIQMLSEQLDIRRLCVNRDYTPYAKSRDQMIELVCERRGIQFESYHDALLSEPGSVLTKAGLPFTVFTPFMKAARAQVVRKPQNFPDHINGYTESVGGSLSPAELEKLLPARSTLSFIKGGTPTAHGQLTRLSKMTNYAEERNIPSLQATSGLSAAHKFGAISIRETYHAALDSLGSDTSLISELYWRDFFTHLAFHYPRVFGNAFQEKYNALRWENDEVKFRRWCEGTTGFPIVDAGMRQMNATGYMHNRVRMITASFLCKDLHIDWRWGEKYFAQKLIDYDPCVNNGSWQWSASTGADAAPYFRIFNPWSQQKKFDPEGDYIRQWVEELKGCDADTLHGLELPLMASPSGYPPPMVDHKSESTKTLREFQRLKAT